MSKLRRRTGRYQDDPVDMKSARKLVTYVYSVSASQYLEAHASFDLFIQDLCYDTIEMGEHLDGDLRFDFALRDEVVEGISHGGTDAGRYEYPLESQKRCGLPAAAVQLVKVLLLLLGTHRDCGDECSV